MATVWPGGSAVRVRGLRELTYSFNRMSKDVADDVVNELIEAADPVRKLATTYLVSGGGGFGPMTNIPATEVYEAERLKIGVSKSQGMVYIVPDWRPIGVGEPRSEMSLHYVWRMEAAVEDSEDKIVHGLEQMIDRMADEFGF